MSFSDSELQTINHATRQLKKLSDQGKIALSEHIRQVGVSLMDGRILMPEMLGVLADSLSEDIQTNNTRLLLATLHHLRADQQDYVKAIDSIRSLMMEQIDPHHQVSDAHAEETHFAQYKQAISALIEIAEAKKQMAAVVAEKQNTGPNQNRL